MLSINFYKWSLGSETEFKIMTTLLENTTNDRLAEAAQNNELELLIGLTAREQIVPRMLVRNLLPILTEEPGLLVDVVLQLTDPSRDFGRVAREEYLDAYRAVAAAERVRARQAILKALEESARLAGYGDLLAQAA